MIKHKKLPHINMLEHYQFITFRTYDSLSLYLKKLYSLNLTNSKKQYLIDSYLDSSNFGAYLFKDAIDIFKNTLILKEGIWYEIVAYAIMPNHIHILLKQKIELFKIVKFIKSKSAIDINRYLNKEGKFWADGYYDKIIRDEKHFLKVYNYILKNPIKANLPDSENRVYGVFE